MAFRRQAYYAWLENSLAGSEPIADAAGDPATSQAAINAEQKSLGSSTQQDTNFWINDRLMPQTFWTKQGMFVSWRLLKALGVFVLCAVFFTALVWLLSSQARIERQLGQAGVAGASTLEPGGAGDGAQNQTKASVEELENLTLELAQGLLNNQDALRQILNDTTTDWIDTRFDASRDHALANRDLLFALTNELSSDGIVRIQAVGPTPRIGGSVSLSEILAENEALLNRTAKTLVSRTYASIVTEVQTADARNQALAELLSKAPVSADMTHLDTGQQVASNADLVSTGTMLFADGTATLSLADELRESQLREAEIASQLTALEDNIALLAEDKNRLQLQLTTTTLAKRNSDLQASQLQAQLASARQSLKALEDEFHSIAVERIDVVRELAALESAKSQLETLTQTQDAKLDAQQAEVAALQTAIADEKQRSEGLIAAQTQNADKQHQALALQIEQLNNSLIQAEMTLASYTQEREALVDQVEELKVAYVVQSGDAASAAAVEQAGGSAVQAAIAAAVEAAMVDKSLEAAAATKLLDDALDIAQRRIDELEGNLVASVVDQRFAEAEYSRALARSERLAAELERRAQDLSTVADLQTQLMQRLSLRYGEILTEERGELTSLSPTLMDTGSLPVPLWGEVERAGEDVGGALLTMQGEADEFTGSPAFGSSTAVNLADITSDVIEFAVSLDQSLSSIESLRQLKGNIPLGAPSEFNRISSNFGPRRNPVTGKYSSHNGIDLAAPSGTPIHVQAPGEVVFAGWRGGFGRFVEVMHAGSVKTRYAHLQRIDVTEGQWVEKSDKLGEVGTSGRSTGPHLHYEIMVGNNWVNPRDWIKATKNVLTQ